MIDTTWRRTLKRSFYGFLLLAIVVSLLPRSTEPLRSAILYAAGAGFFVFVNLVIHAMLFDPNFGRPSRWSRFNPLIRQPRPLGTILREAREARPGIQAFVASKLQSGTAPIPPENANDVCGFLVDMTGSKDGLVRSEATLALGIIASRLPDDLHPPITQRLLELSRDSGAGVLKEAAFALGLAWKAHAPDQKGLVTGQLLTMMESGEETVAEAASDALYSVEPWGDQTANEAVSKRIVPLCHRKEPWIASSAIGKLGAFSSSLSPAWKKTALDEALRVIDDAEWPMGYGAIESLSWLAPSLVGAERSRALGHLLSFEKSRDQFVRTSLAENLARTLRSLEGADRDLVANTLFRMAAEKKKLVRRTATKSLEENRDVLSPRAAKTLDDLNSR